MRSLLIRPSHTSWRKTVHWQRHGRTWSPRSPSPRRR